MTLTRALASGYRSTFTSPALRALAWTYAALLAVSAVLVVPLFVFVASSTSGSAMASSLRAGRMTDWLVDISGQPGSRATLGVLFVVGLLLVVVYLLLVSCIAGGVFDYILDALSIRRRETTFLRSCAIHVGPMSRLALMEAPVVGAIAFGLMVARAVAEAIELGAFASWIWLVGALLVVGALTSLFDFARVAVVLDAERSALRAILSAVRFVTSRLAATAGLVVVNVLVATAVLAGLVSLHSLVPLDSTLGIISGFAVGQASVVGRLWSRLAWQASETSLRAREA